MLGFFVSVARAQGVIDDATPISVVLLNVLNFLLSIAGVLAILALAVSGTLYFIAAGDESRARQAKRAASFSALGLAVILGALIVVRQIAGFF